MAVLFILLSFAVAAELAVHLWWHWKTGKAGLYDKPFAYLKDVRKELETWAAR